MKMKEYVKTWSHKKRGDGEKDKRNLLIVKWFVEEERREQRRV